MTKKLSKGDRAPDFTLQDQEGRTIQLADLKGQKVLLYAYPRADTPGCTKQACSVRDSRTQLGVKGIKAIGFSPDEKESLQKFDQKYSLGFQLLSDPDHRTASAYGAWGEKNLDGKKNEGIIRSAFLLDEQGQIVDAWYNVKPEETVERALAAIP